MAQPGNGGEPNGVQEQIAAAADDDLAEDLGAMGDDDDDDEEDAQNEAGNGNAVQGELHLVRQLPQKTVLRVTHFCQVFLLLAVCEIF